MCRRFVTRSEFLARGVLIREGPLEKLIAIENQIELVLENAPDALMERIATLVRDSDARIVDHRTPQTTLEKLFLEATREERQD